MENRQICTEFQIIYVDTSLTQVKHNSLLFKCGIGMMASFQKIQYGKGGKIEYPTNTTSVRGHLT